MSMASTYRNTINRKRNEYANLQKDLATATKKAADINKKINSANQTLSRTTSSSTAKSKVRETERLNKDLGNFEKKKADISTKIAKVGKEISDIEQKLQKEEAKEFKKREAEAKRMQQGIETTLKAHDRLHHSTQAAIRRLENLPEKIIVLFLASNPVDQNQLRLDEENRKITQMIRLSDHRDSVELVSAWAVQPLDVLQAINEHEPAIIHFSGHGTSDEIAFQDNQGLTKLVSTEALVQTMVASSDNIRFVFLNACHSKNTALAAAVHVEAAIGMNEAIGDEAAAVFSAQFYSAIGFGKNIKVAFEQAKAALMLESIPEENIPELFVKDGLDPEKIIIVKPQN